MNIPPLSHPPPLCLIVWFLPALFRYVYVNFCSSPWTIPSPHLLFLPSSPPPKQIMHFSFPPSPEHVTLQFKTIWPLCRVPPFKTAKTHVPLLVWCFFIFIFFVFHGRSTKVNKVLTLLAPPSFQWIRYFDSFISLFPFCWLFRINWTFFPLFFPPNYQPRQIPQPFLRISSKIFEK